MPALKTLVIAPFSPYPLIFGGAIRLYHVLRMLAATSEVTLVAFHPTPGDTDVVRHLEGLCERVILVDGPPVERQPKWSLQVKGLLGPHSFQYHAFVTPRFQAAIDGVLRERRYDRILVEQSQMGYYRCHQRGALHILDLQNIEHELLERRAKFQSNRVKGLALAVEAAKYRRQELAIAERYQLVFTPSEREAARLRALLRSPRVECLPNSIDPWHFPFRPGAEEGNEVTFIGATHVDANRDGVVFFVEQVLPLIRREVGDVRVNIVGGSPPPEIRAYDRLPDVSILGFVEDVRPFMTRSKVLVVPLRTGGGTRLKLLEGLSAGVPTVSTSLGAEGLDLVHGRDALIADTPAAFSDSVVRLLRDPGLRERLARAGRRVAEERYSWVAVGARLEELLVEAGRATVRELPEDQYL